MRAGALRHRVRIEQPPTGRDSGGGFTGVWTLLDVVAAEITSEDGGEPSEGGSPRSTIRHRVRIRFRTGITPSMRAVFNTRSFRILSVVDPDGGRRELILTCVEKVDDQAA
jgi:SPP1 family predicted phage head-tail adaptor